MAATVVNSSTRPHEARDFGEMDQLSPSTDNLSANNDRMQSSGDDGMSGSPTPDNDQNVNDIQSLPNEILLNVLGRLSPVDKVCLALTSHFFEKVVMTADKAEELRDIVPYDCEPDSTGTEHHLCCRSSHCELMERLEVWIGSYRYMPCALCNGRKFVTLLHRWCDTCIIDDFGQWTYQGKPCTIANKVRELWDDARMTLEFR